MPERIQLTSEQRERLGSKLGLDPWGFDAIDDGEGSIEIVPVETEDRNPISVAARQFGANLPTSFESGVGAGVGAKAGQVLGTRLGGLAGRVGGPVGAIVGGIAGPLAIEQVLPDINTTALKLTGYDEPLQLERDMAEHPLAAKAGQVGSSIAGFTGRAAGEVGDLLTGMGKLTNLDRLAGLFQRGKKGLDPSALGLSTAEKRELLSEAISQPIGMGLEVINQMQSPEDLDLGRVGLEAVGNLAFGGSRFTPKPRGLRALTPQPAAAEPSRPAAPEAKQYTQQELPGMPRPDDAPPRADIEAVLQRRNELQELARNKAEDEFYTTASRQDDLPFDEAEILVREQRLKELEDASRTAAEGKETLSPDELAQARADEQAIIAGRYQKAGDPAQGVISDLEMLQRRGIPQRFVPEIVGPDGGQKAGAFTGDETLYSEKYIRESTPVHEGMHAETAQMRQSENPHDARVLAKMLAAADEEDIARAGEKYAGENSPFAGWVKDNWSYVKTRFGFGTPEDAARVLYSRLRNTSPEARPFQAEGGKTPEYQDYREQTKTPAFKTWFGDWQRARALSEAAVNGEQIDGNENARLRASLSKVVDFRTGEPLRMFHGTRRSGFSEFDPNKTSELGFHFGTQEQANDFVPSPGGQWKAMAEVDPNFFSTSGIYPVYLDIKNPLTTPDLYKTDATDFVYWAQDAKLIPDDIAKEAIRLADGHEYAEAWNLVKQALKAKGYDGIRYMNAAEGAPGSPENEAWIAFEPEQVKSASANKGTWDRTQKNIQYQDAFDFAPKREFNSDRPFGLTIANDGTLPTQNLLAKLDKSLNRGDRELLRFAGLDRYLESKDRVDVKKLRQWIADNEPKVEVKELFAVGNRTPEQLELATLTHEWYDNLPQKVQALLQGVLNNEDYPDIQRRILRTIYSENQNDPDIRMETVDRYLELRRITDKQPKVTDKNDSATLEYQQVNPRELKDMPGAVDLLVRMPTKNRAKLARIKELEAKGRKRRTEAEENEYAALDADLPIKYPAASTHYPDSGDNLLTHVRAYEHELPDGRRVLRVFELQSDWAQSKGKQEEFIKKALKTFDESAKARLIDDPDRPGKKIWVVYPKGDDKFVFTKATNAEEALAEARANIKVRENASLTSQERINSHPLLDHTNRLGLKAAIEHARKRGLDGVVIDDADTVMLTEGHDRVRTETIDVNADPIVSATETWIKERDWGNDWQDGKYIRFRGDLYRVDKPENNVKFKQEIARELAPYWGTDRHYIPQRGGMELNYNKLLPAAMSDITGAAPQRVNLGEHKNAVEVRRERIPGTNTEPEDSPLDLSDVREIVEPRADLIIKNQDGTPKTESTGLFFPLGKAGERRAAGEPFTLTGARYQPIETEPVPGSLFRAVYESNPEMGQRLQRFATTQNELQGMFNVRTLQNLVQIPREVREAAAAKRDMEYATGLPQTYTPDEQVYIDLLNDFNIYTRDVANNRGGARINRDPFYQPQMLSAEFMARIGQGTQQEIDAAINAVLPEYLLYNQRFAAGHYDPVEAENYLRRYLARVMNEQGGANVEFAALTRGARPYGLPPSLREVDPLRALERYANRWSRDVARHETIASNPAAAHFFGLTPDAQGNRAVMSTEVQAARKYLYGNLTPQAATNRTLANIPSAQRFVSAALIGPMTATRNILSTISQNATALSIPELLTVPMRYARLIGDWADTWQRAAQMNVVRPDNDRYTFGADVDIATRMGQNLQRAAGAMRRMTGTELLETLDRLLTYSVGEGKFDLYRPLFDANDPDAQAFFRMYGAAVDTAEPIDMQRAKVAANYTRAIQTSYDAEDLPRLMLSNRGAAYGLRLQRWGVSNLNRLRERVFRPAREGNYLPLITYLGAVFGISVPLIEKFNEMVRGKDRRPTSKEIETVSEDPEIEKLLNVMELADTGSLFGILGTFAGATAENIRGGNRALVSEPLTTSTIDAAVGLGRLATALIEGEDPLKATLMFMDEQVLRKIQALRPLLEQDEMREDKRNKAVLQSLAGDKATVEEVIINGLGIGRWSRLPKLSPAKKAVQKTGDQEARKFLQSKGQSIRDLNNYPGGFEEPRKERALRAFIGETQGEEALEDYLARRNAFKARVLGREK